jgi:hypothetical protein
MNKLLSFFVFLMCISGVDASPQRRTVASIANKAIEMLAAATDTSIQPVHTDDYTLERVARRHILKKIGGETKPYAVADFLGIGIGAWGVLGYDLPQDVKNILSQYKEGSHWYLKEMPHWGLRVKFVFHADENVLGVQLSQEDADVLLKRVIAQHIVDVCAEGSEKEKCQDILQGSTFSSSHKLRIYRFIVDKEVRATTRWVQNLYADKAQVPEGLKHAWGNLHLILGEIREKYSTYDLSTAQQRLVDLENVKRGFCYQSQIVHADFQQKKILPSGRLASSVLDTVSRGLDARVGIEWRYEEAAERLAAAWTYKLAADAERSDSERVVAAPVVPDGGPAGAGSGARPDEVSGRVESVATDESAPASGTVASGVPVELPQPVLSAQLLSLKDRLLFDLESLHGFTSMIKQGPVAKEVDNLRKRVMSAHTAHNQHDELQACRTALDDYWAKPETQRAVMNGMRIWMRSHPQWKMPATWHGCRYVQEMLTLASRELQAHDSSSSTRAPAVAASAYSAQLLPLVIPTSATQGDAGFISDAPPGDMAVVAALSQPLSLPVRAPGVAALAESESVNRVREDIDLSGFWGDDALYGRRIDAQPAPVHISRPAVLSVVPNGQPEPGNPSVQPAPAAQPNADSRPGNPSAQPAPAAQPAVSPTQPNAGSRRANPSAQPAPAAKPAVSPAQPNAGSRRANPRAQPASVSQPGGGSVELTARGAGPAGLSKQAHSKSLSPQFQKHDTTLARGVGYAGGAITVGFLGYWLAQMLKDTDSRAVIARAFKKLAGKKVAPLTTRQRRAAKRLQRDGGIAGAGTVAGIATVLGGWLLRKRNRVA